MTTTVPFPLPPLAAAPVGAASDPSSAPPPPPPSPECGAGCLPKILTVIIARLNEYLLDPQACLPSLNAANGSQRQQRTERRTACVKLLGAHVRYMDLVSLRVGIPQRDGSFLSLTLPFLARKAGIGLRRAERAMRDLQLAGLVSSQQRCELTEEGQYKGLAALRQLPAALFGAFGMGKWLRHERSKAVMRRYRAATAQARVERRTRKEAHGSLFLVALKHRMQAGSRGGNRPAATRVDDADDNDYVRRRIGILKQQHPDWDRDACYQMAYSELPPNSVRFTRTPTCL